MDFFELENEQLVALSEIISDKLAEGLDINELYVLSNFVGMISSNLGRYAALEGLKESRRKRRC